MQNFIKLANENPWFALTLILVLILIFNIIKRTRKWVLLTYFPIYIMLTCIIWINTLISIHFNVFILNDIILVLY